jgi:hypothetical protein
VPALSPSCRVLRHRLCREPTHSLGFAQAPRNHVTSVPHISEAQRGRSVTGSRGGLLLLLKIYLFYVDGVTDDFDELGQVTDTPASLTLPWPCSALPSFGRAVFPPWLCAGVPVLVGGFLFDWVWVRCVKGKGWVDQSAVLATQCLTFDLSTYLTRRSVPSPPPDSCQRTHGPPAREFRRRGPNGRYPHPHTPLVPD